jgi:cell division ATPase FtsA
VLTEPFESPARVAKPEEYGGTARIVRAPEYVYIIGNLASISRATGVLGKSVIFVTALHGIEQLAQPADTNRKEWVGWRRFRAILRGSCLREVISWMGPRYLRSR